MTPGPTSALAVDAQAAARALIAGPVTDTYAGERPLEELSARFAEHGYVRLRGLLAEEPLEILRRQISALEAHARARDFVMSGPDTPRVMSVLGATQLLAGSPAAAILYVHFELVRVIGRLAGTEVYGCTHPEELMVCNLLLSEGSTHGWHLDDPAYALVVMLEAPVRDGGGELEYIPDWADLRRRLGLGPDDPVDAAVATARAEGLVRTADHRAGDAYLLRADRCLHRVTPLCSPRTRRVALNFAYEATATASYGDSATLLYGSDE